MSPIPKRLQRHVENLHIRLRSTTTGWIAELFDEDHIDFASIDCPDPDEALNFALLEMRAELERREEMRRAMIEQDTCTVDEKRAEMVNDSRRAG